MILLVAIKESELETFTSPQGPRYSSHETTCVELEMVESVGICLVPGGGICWRGIVGQIMMNDLTPIMSVVSQKR